MNLQTLKKLPEKERHAFLKKYKPKDLEALWHHWPFLARPEQLPPPGDWSTWIYLAGRGAGKTRTGGETCRQWVKEGYKRLGMIAPTAGDARDVMIEGESGLLNSVSWKGDYDNAGQYMGIPVYEPSKRRVTWANGAMASLYSADEPERLRGPQHEAIWADELASWTHPEAWDMAMFGLRIGKHPKTFVSTTPKPVKLLIEILKNPYTVKTHGTTYDNRDNLAPSFFKQVITKYEGTRLGQQELLGDILEESEQALWARDTLDNTRVKSLPKDLWFKRLVVAIDPATTSKSTSNMTGIVVVGLGSDNHIYVLNDSSGIYSPDEWAKKAIRLYHAWQCDSIVAEVNQGGDMVKHTLRTVEAIPIQTVRAARAKQARAEPVSALWEQGRAHIVGSMPMLEDQLCQWEPLSGAESPDRLDALVWGVTFVGVLNQVVGEGKIGGLY